jgi:branched-chain amino acid transport system ATP-binding protein
MSKAVLQFNGVHTHIGQYHILHGVDFDVPEGEITVLLGRNGAGKTTTLRTIMGLWQASRGTITFAGQNLVGRETDQIARAGIAYVPENMGIFGGLTVRENMILAARAGSFEPRRLGWLLDLFPPLRTFWDLPAAYLSGGQKQMLSIARALIEEHRLLLVDEPTKGIAPAIVDNMITAFEELKRARITVLLVEQNFEFASTLGDNAIVMDDGRIVHAGPMSELAADTARQEAFLGLAFEAPH